MNYAGGSFITATYCTLKKYLRLLELTISPFSGYVHRQCGFEVVVVLVVDLKEFLCHIRGMCRACALVFGDDDCTPRTRTPYRKSRGQLATADGDHPAFTFLK